ncbi:MAG: 50S ribosomal protein L16 [Promethearchaeota archaeon]
MAKRPWYCYAKWRRPPYQKKRSRTHRKEYVTGGADPSLRQYNTGNIKKPFNEWELSLGIKVMHRVQISDSTLEAMRVSLNRNLRKKLTVEAFHIRIRPHPWQVYRENKMMAFAGADRLQSGMRGSFGRNVGRCARVKAGQTIVDVFCDFKNKDKIIRALKIASYKIGTKTRLVILRIKDISLVQKIGIPLALEKKNLAKT